MADTFTAFLNMTLPEIGASDDTWGDKLNDNFDILDALFATTGEGTVVVRDGDDNALTSGINIRKAAGNNRVINLFSGASSRWSFGAESGAETGSNAGSDFFLNRYGDDGSFIGGALGISRATGAVTFEVTPKVGGNDVIHKGNISNIALPIGAPIPWLTSNLPTGWLWMNGIAVSRTTYPLLFAELGTFYGAGNGSTTFNLPDWREVIPLGVAGMGSTGGRGLTSFAGWNVMGTVYGSQDVTLSAAQMPVHTHTGITSTPTTFHSHAVKKPANYNTPAQVVGGASAFFWTGGPTTESSGDDSPLHVHTFTTDASGSSTSHNNMPPTTTCGWIIKALE